MPQNESRHYSPVGFFDRRQFLRAAVYGGFTTALTLTGVAVLGSDRDPIQLPPTKSPPTPTPTPTRVAIRGEMLSISPEIGKEKPTLPCQIVDQWNVLCADRDLERFAQAYTMNGDTVEIYLNHVIPGKNGDADIPITIDPLQKITLKQGNIVDESGTMPRPDEGITGGRLLRGMPLGRTDLCIAVISGKKRTEFSETLPIEPAATYPDPRYNPLMSRVSTDGSVGSGILSDIYIDSVEPLNRLGAGLWRVIITDRANRPPFTSDITVHALNRHVIAIPAKLFEKDPTAGKLENNGYIRCSQEAMNILLNPEKNEDFDQAAKTISEIQEFLGTHLVSSYGEQTLPKFLAITDIRSYIPPQNWKPLDINYDDSQKDAKLFLYGFIPTLIHKYKQFKEGYAKLGPEERKVIDTLAYQTLEYVVLSNIYRNPLASIPNLGVFIREDSTVRPWRTGY